MPYVTYDGKAPLSCHGLLCASRGLAWGLRNEVYIPLPLIKHKPKDRTKG